MNFLLLTTNPSYELKSTIATGIINIVSSKQYNIVGNKDAKETRFGFNPITSIPIASTDVTVYNKEIYVLASIPRFFKRYNVSKLKYIAGI